VHRPEHLLTGAASYHTKTARIDISSDAVERMELLHAAGRGPDPIDCQLAFQLDGQVIPQQWPVTLTPDNRKSRSTRRYHVAGLRGVCGLLKVCILEGCWLWLPQHVQPALGTLCGEAKPLLVVVLTTRLTLGDAASGQLKPSTRARQRRTGSTSAPVSLAGQSSNQAEGDNQENGEQTSQGDEGEEGDKPKAGQRLFSSSRWGRSRLGAAERSSLKPAKVAPTAQQKVR
jgi:hypothetical protein